MPRAATDCSEPGCPNAQPCPTHQRQPWAGRAPRRRSGSSRQKLRRFVLHRDDGVCYLCGKPGATEADHVVPIAEGGEDHVDNMRAAHHDCHKRKTLDEARRARAAA